MARAFDARCVGRLRGALAPRSSGDPRTDHTLTLAARRLAASSFLVESLVRHVRRACPAFLASVRVATVRGQNAKRAGNLVGYRPFRDRLRSDDQRRAGVLLSLEPSLGSIPWPVNCGPAASAAWCHTHDVPGSAAPERATRKVFRLFVR